MNYKKITGVIPILQTPFDKSGRIDTESLSRVVDYNIEAGVDGLGIALASEVLLLNESERDLLLKTVVGQTNNRVPVVMNTDANGNDLAIYYSKRAEELGADAVMLTPPNSGVVRGNPEITRQYFRDIESAIGVSVVLQDVEFAQVPPQMVADMAQECPGIVACKMETPPTAPRIAATVDALQGKIVVLGGGGATYLMEELARGSSGTMPFSSTPAEFMEIMDVYVSGNIEKATKIFNLRIAPLCHLVSQAPELAIGFHKQILKRRGLIESARVREPAASPDKHTQRDIDALLERVIV
ncbi:MAG: dihydrodipicolinate synthase family protein [Chloroflexi bacterium]|nr:dihydrodipicolinate synthase family protein [Chloroflexota bacterium]